MSRWFKPVRLLQLAILIGVSGFARTGTSAQALPAALQASAQPTFDIVSIHPMRQDDKSPEHIENPSKSGYVRAVNVNLKSLMEVAYDVPDLRMFGGPSWLTSERFSLEAKADPSLNEQLTALPAEQAKQIKRQMMAALLVDKFKLAVHTVTREMPVYALVVAKDGPKLGGTKPSDGSKSAGGQFLEIRPGSNSLEILAYELSWRVGRPVLDRTGLHDSGALTLWWREDEETAADSNAPSLFAAIQEQLGLKLEATRGPVPVLLIDHAEKPSENP